MRDAWRTFARIPVKYTAVTLFCLLVVVLVAVGQDGERAVVPALAATLLVAVPLVITRRRRRVPARQKHAAPALPQQRQQPPARPAPARVASPRMAGPIQSAFAAEPGWRAVFGEGNDSTMSRVVGWALTTGEGGASELVGLIVDPADPSRVVAASGVVTPEGHSLTRYGYKDA
jgi:hypothetical protein